MSSASLFMKSSAPSVSRTRLSRPAARACSSPSASCYFRFPRPSVIRFRHIKSPNTDFSSRCNPGPQQQAADDASTNRQRRYVYPSRGMRRESGMLSQLMQDLYHELAEITPNIMKEVESLEPRRVHGDWRLAADVSEEDTSYTIKVDVPGISKEDIKLKISEERALVLSAERKMKTGEDNQESEQGREESLDGKWKSTERRFGKFTRVFKLPKNVDKEGIVAEIKDGVLTVVLPKVKEEAADKERVISIM